MRVKMTSKHKRRHTLDKVESNSERQTSVFSSRKSNMLSEDTEYLHNPFQFHFLGAAYGSSQNFSSQK